MVPYLIAIFGKALLKETGGLKKEERLGWLTMILMGTIRLESTLVNLILIILVRLGLLSLKSYLFLLGFVRIDNKLKKL